MQQASNEVDRFTAQAPPAGPPIWRRWWFWVVVYGTLLLGVAALVVSTQWDTYWQAKYKYEIATLRERGKLEEAAAVCEEAIAAYPDSAEFYFERAVVRHAQEKYDLALADLDHVLKGSPTFGEGYVERGHIHMKLRDYPKALADLAEARKWGSEADHVLLNDHAYLRALAGQDLTLALEDINQALYLLEQDTAAMTRSGALAAANYRKAIYLDTRGYLLFLTGENDKALADLDVAIQLFEKFLERTAEAASSAKDSAAALERRKKDLNESLGALCHHRGLVHEKLGNDDKAAADFKRRDELGFDPAKE